MRIMGVEKAYCDHLPKRYSVNADASPRRRFQTHVHRPAHAISKNIAVLHALNSVECIQDSNILADDEWIDVNSMGALDVAITNRRTRILWLQDLHLLLNSYIDNWMHNASWLASRNIGPSTFNGHG